MVVDVDVLVVEEFGDVRVSWGLQFDVCVL